MGTRTSFGACWWVALAIGCSRGGSAGDTEVPVADVPVVDGADGPADASDVPGVGFCQGPIEAVFDPASGLVVPFPSDLFTVEDPTTPTGRSVSFTLANSAAEPMFALYPSLRDELNALDGWGTTAGVVFAFSQEIGTPTTVAGETVVLPPRSLEGGPGSTIAADAPIVLIGIQEGSADYGQAIPLLVKYVSSVAMDGTGQHYVIGEPVRPLRPKTAYAAALTVRLTDAGGACIAPSEATRDLLAGRDPTRFGRLGQMAPRAVAVLREAGFIASAGEISALTVFTTQSIEEEIVAAVQSILVKSASTPPRVTDGSLVVTPGSGGVALEVRGTYRSNRYLGPDGTFVIEHGVPVVQGVEEIEFLLTIPEETATNRPPFPLVIHEHGLAGTKEEDMGMKRAQARAGFATIAIDAVMHGSRALPTGLDVTNFFGIDLDRLSFRMPVTRDNFRQTYLDTVTLGELAATLATTDFWPMGAPDGVPEVAASPLYLTGHSLGGSMGAAVAALSPRIAIANLCAGGGGVLNIILRSDLFGVFILALKPPESTVADVHRIFPVLQTLVDRGDPANYARLVTNEPLAALGASPRHVLFQEVEKDTYVPNITNELLGRALGLTHVRPVVHEVFGLPQADEPLALNHPLGVSTGFFQFDRQEGGTQPAFHTDIFADEVAQTQWIHFFVTYRDAGRPEIVDPYRVLHIPRP